METIAVIFGVSIGIFISYVFFKIKVLETRIKSIDPEALAREIIKVKIPISELPQDMQDRIAESKNKKSEKTEESNRGESYFG